MPTLVTDDQFIAVWQKIGSPTYVAKAFGLSERAVHKRRAAIEKRLGISLESKFKAGGGLRDKSHNPARREIRIDNGHVLIASDAHYYPDIVSTAHRAFVRMCRDVKPVAVVMNGDAFDGATISRHPRIGWDNKPTVIQELKAVEERLTEIEEAAGTKELYWPLGNHDSRYETHLAAHAPQYEGIKGFHLKDHFPMWRPCWSLWINDDVVVKHRIRNGVHAAHTNTVAAGRSTVTGHLHSLKVTPYTDYNGSRWGVDTGTLAAPAGPQFIDYLEDNPVNWRSGFVLLTFHNGRLLWPQVIHVIDENAGLVEFGCSVFSV